MKLSAKVAVVEFTASRVRVAVVATGGKRPSVIEAHTEPVRAEEGDEPGSSLGAAFESIVKRMKSRRAPWLICASSRQAIVRNLTLPFTGKGRVGAAVRFELEPYLAFPIDELAVDFCIAREGGGETEALVVGMKRDRLGEQVAALEAAGVTPEGILIDAAALAALSRATGGHDNRPRAELHVRAQGAALCVVEGRKLLALRSLQLDPAALHGNPGAAAREVLNSIRAFTAGARGGAAPAELVVTGVELFPEERQLFEDAVRMEVHYSHLLERVRGTDRLAAAETREGEPPESGAAAIGPEDHNRWEPLVGAACSAAGEGFLLNFLKGPLCATNPLRRFVPHAVVSGLLAVALAAAYVGYCVVDYRQNRQAMRLMAYEMHEILADCFPDSPALEVPWEEDPGGQMAYMAMEGAIEEMGGAAQGVPLALFDRPSLLDILNELSERVPRGRMTIASMEMRGGYKPLLTITGEITDAAASTQIYENLQASDMLVLNEEPTRVMKPGGNASITIRAEIAGGDKWRR